MNRLLSSETVHASTVAMDGRAVLINGPSGSGKSDLALRLLDRGFTLVSDDQTIVRREGDRLIASAPPTIKGKLEIRGIGIVEMETVDNVPVALLVDDLMAFKDAAVFVLERVPSMMFALCGDVSACRVQIRRGDGERAVSGLPRERGEFSATGLDPLRRCRLRLFDNAGNGDRSRQFEQDVHVVFDRIHRGDGTPGMRQRSGHVGVQVVAYGVQ